MSELFILPPPLDVLSSVDIRRRQSIREFSDSSLDIECVGTILYAAQGVRHNGEKRLVPSAGGLFPLSIHLAVRSVTSLVAGLYSYKPHRHGLMPLMTGSPLSQIADAAFDASWLGRASAALLISAEFERTTIPYAHQPPKGRAERYVWLEAGHSAQNAALAATALSLATVFVGGFDDELMSRAFRLAKNERPIGVLPLGYPV